MTAVFKIRFATGKFMKDSFVIGLARQAGVWRKTLSRERVLPDRDRLARGKLEAQPPLGTNSGHCASLIEALPLVCDEAALIDRLGTP